MTSYSKLINVCFSSGAQRLMVKTTQKSDLPWSTIFSVIVYWNRCEQVSAQFWLTILFSGVMLNIRSSFFIIYISKCSFVLFQVRLPWFSTDHELPQLSHVAYWNASNLTEQDSNVSLVPVWIYWNGIFSNTIVSFPWLCKMDFKLLGWMEHVL